MKTMCVLLAAALSLPLAGNIVGNGAFEKSDPNGKPAVWRVTGDVKIGKGVGIDGGCALKLCGKGRKARVSQDVDVVPGKSYRLSADIKASGGETCVFAEWFGEDGKWKGGFYCRHVSDTEGKWHHSEKISKPIAAGVSKLRIYAQHKTKDADRKSVV